MAKATATPSAPAAGAPASQRENNAAAANTGTIVQDKGFTDLLLAELDDAPERPSEERAPARRVAKPAKPAEGDEPGDEDPEGEEPEAGAGEGEESPAEGAEGEETPADRLERLQQQEGESDKDYAARLKEEGVDPAELAEEIETERQARLQQQEGESDEDYAARLEAEGVDPADVEKPEAPKVPKALQKRFGELTGKIRALEAENTRLKAAPAQTRAPSSLEEEVQAARTPEQLDAIQAKFEAWEEFALAHPDGHEIPGKDGGDSTVYTPEQVRTILLTMRRGLRAIPGQARFIEQAKAQDTAAHKAFPAYNDAESSLSKAYDAIVQRAPALARAVPDLKLFVADALRGRDLRTKGARQPLPGKPAARVQAPPPGGRGAPLRGKPGAGDARAAAQAKRMQRVEETGSAEDLAELLESRIGG